MAEANEAITKTKGLQFRTTLEVLAIYIAAFITFLTFFDYINIGLYTLLGAGALLAFFTIAFAMGAYIIYNFIVFFKAVLT